MTYIPGWREPDPDPDEEPDWAAMHVEAEADHWNDLMETTHYFRMAAEQVEEMANKGELHRLEVDAVLTFMTALIDKVAHRRLKDEHRKLKEKAEGSDHA